MNIQNLIKLENRIRKLEKKIYEAKPKPNLFSKKIENVKAAVESGENINKINDSGKSPLANACQSKVDTYELVKYMLDVGAVPNDYYKDKPVEYIALDYKNYGALRALQEHGANFGDGDDIVLLYAIRKLKITDPDVLKLLIPNEYRGIGNLNRLAVGRSICEIYSDGKISDKDFRMLFDMVCDANFPDEPKKQEYIIWVSGYEIDVSIRKNKLELLKYCFDNKVIPNIWQVHSCIKNNKSAMEYFFDTIKNVCESGNFKKYHYDSGELVKCLYTCGKALDKPINFMYTLFADEFKKDGSNSTIFDYMVFDCLRDNDIQTLKAIAKSGRRLNCYDKLANELLKGNYSNEMLKAACRLFNKIGPRDLEFTTVRDICNSNKKIIIQYLLTYGYTEAILSRVNKGEVSPECIEVVEENGYTMEDIASNADKYSKYTRALNSVEFGFQTGDIDKIKNVINEYPKIVNDDWFADQMNKVKKSWPEVFNKVLNCIKSSGLTPDSKYNF